ncbi:Non-reducing end beta-L-arabinofuranosidase [Fusarium oxysporum f. sp. albedinis]|nr:Non-reducing end beta-L-arabinofuranosidase [Fusarium oxysporum f. sp. albedinis]
MSVLLAFFDEDGVTLDVVQFDFLRPTRKVKTQGPRVRFGAFSTVHDLPHSSLFPSVSILNSTTFLKVCRLDNFNTKGCCDDDDMHPLTKSFCLS